MCKNLIKNLFTLWNEYGVKEFFFSCSNSENCYYNLVIFIYFFFLFSIGLYYFLLSFFCLSVYFTWIYFCAFPQCSHFAMLHVYARLLCSILLYIWLLSRVEVIRRLKYVALWIKGRFGTLYIIDKHCIFWFLSELMINILHVPPIWIFTNATNPVGESRRFEINVLAFVLVVSSMQYSEEKTDFSSSI